MAEVERNGADGSGTDGAAAGGTRRYDLLSVIVPVYNERVTVAEIIRRIRAVDVPIDVVGNGVDRPDPEATVDAPELVGRRGFTFLHVSSATEALRASTAASSVGRSSARTRPSAIDPTSRASTRTTVAFSRTLGVVVLATTRVPACSASTGGNPHPSDFGTYATTVASRYRPFNSARDTRPSSTAPRVDTSPQP